MLDHKNADSASCDHILARVSSEVLEILQTDRSSLCQLGLGNLLANLYFCQESDKNKDLVKLEICKIKCTAIKFACNIIETKVKILD